MPTKQQAKGRPDGGADHLPYAEERIPFDLVMRKLANTKPPHKTAKSAPTPAPKKS